MATKADRTTILDALEDNFRHDLAVHLYSTFLLHQINPVFPKRNWASWPLKVIDVPDPRTSTKYADCVVPANQFSEDIGTNSLETKVADEIYSDESFTNDNEDEENNETRIDINNSVKGKQNINYNRDFSDEKQTETVEDKDEDDEDDQEVEALQVMKIRTVSFQESITNSKSNLMNELIALMERTINKKLKMHKDLNIGEIPSKISREISKRLANKIDKIFNHLIKAGKSSTFNSYAKRSFLRLLNWQDILIAGIAVEESSKQTTRIESLSQIYKKCEILFEELKYKYEYDNDNEDLDVNEKMNDNELFNGIHSDQIEERGDVQHNIEFNRVDYLDSLEKLNKFSAIYKNLKLKTLKSKKEEDQLKHLKKILYYRKLSLNQNYDFLLWEKKRKALSTPNQKKKKRFKINSETRNSSKYLALSHGGIHIDEDDYMI